MATPNKTPHRTIVTLSLPKRVPALVVYAQGIAQQMAGNPSFPNPTPTLAALNAAIADLQAAETAGASVWPSAVEASPAARPSAYRRMRSLG